MRRKIAISLLWIYLIGISGMAVSAHFCCGQLASVKLAVTVEHAPHHQPQLDEACCRDFTQFLKLRDAHQLSSFIGWHVDAWLLQRVFLVFSPEHIFSHPQYQVHDVFAPHSPPLFVLHQVWLI